MVENVERHMEAGLSSRAAAKKAMGEVAGPVIAIVLVLCARCSSWWILEASPVSSTSSPPSPSPSRWPSPDLRRIDPQSGPLRAASRCLRSAAGFFGLLQPVLRVDATSIRCRCGSCSSTAFCPW
ncbi:MAG: hypothetical protein U0231_06515 [Nitrospiraceae bacterium]